MGLTAADDLSYLSDGAKLFAGVLRSEQLRALEEILSSLPKDQAGLRLRDIDGLASFLDSSSDIGRCATSVLGNDARTVRAILFDKTADMNWALGWHQDRTIAVRERRPVDCFRNLNLKSGMQHVEPPSEIMSRMVTLRVHIDPVPSDNAPLLIALGSHKLGRVSDTDAREIALRSETAACLAEPGDVWLYSTPILHASEAAMVPKRRRVLQVDYSADELPGELEWLGI
jgi:ectoine hydroxylase-related dioxygenase (phytanoyl-CoA dioxygenase family)